MLFCGRRQKPKENLSIVSESFLHLGSELPQISNHFELSSVSELYRQRSGRELFEELLSVHFQSAMLEADQSRLSRHVDEDVSIKVFRGPGGQRFLSCAQVGPLAP